MALLLPLTPALLRSVAVSVWLPGVFRVAVKVPVPVPATSVVFDGRPLPAATAPSVLVNWIVSLKLVSVLLNWSLAVTVKLVLLSVKVLDGAVTTKWVAGAGVTVMLPLMPLWLVASVAVMTQGPPVTCCSEAMAKAKPLGLKVVVVETGGRVGVSVLVKVM